MQHACGHEKFIRNKVKFRWISGWKTSKKEATYDIYAFMAGYDMHIEEIGRVFVHW